MLFAMLFAFWRFMEIITLIPTMGMLAYFVHGYNEANMLTPNYILILFIVSVLSLAWAIFTLFSYHRSSHNARFVSLIDLGFVGAFIAAVYYLRFITNANCTSIQPGSSYDIILGIFGNASIDKTCAMLKACFAFGIMNCIFFFITAVLAYIHGGHQEKVVVEKRYYHSRRHHRGSHHSRRSHSGSRHSSSRRSHSHQHAYV